MKKNQSRQVRTKGENDGPRDTTQKQMVSGIGDMNVLEEKAATPFPSQSPPHPAQDRDTGIGSHFSSLGLLGFM